MARGSSGQGAVPHGSNTPSVGPTPAAPDTTVKPFEFLRHDGPLEVLRQVEPFEIRRK